MGVIDLPGGGWWEFEGEEPPGFVATRADEDGDPDSTRQVLRAVGDDPAERAQ
ncbi:MAG: hypothetical protein ACRDXB_19430 [Actinomycetes bacterium]